MKKIIAATLCGVLALSMLVGCGAKPAAKINSAADLEGKKIAVQEGTTGDEYVTKNIKDAEAVRFKKAIDTGIELKNGKVDAIVIDALPAKRICAQIPDLAILDEELTKEEYAIAVRKEDTELLEKINATLKRIKEDGTYDKFSNAYMPEEGDLKPLPERPASSATETIKMGTNAEFEPFEYRDNERIVGFDIEIANEIANDMGKKLEVEDMNFDSLVAALTTKKVDMVIAGMSVTEEKKESVNFSDPYFNASQVIIVRKDSLSK